MERTYFVERLRCAYLQYAGLVDAMSRTNAKNVLNGKEIDSGLDFWKEDLEKLDKDFVKLFRDFVKMKEAGKKRVKRRKTKKIRASSKTIR